VPGRRRRGSSSACATPGGQRALQRRKVGRVVDDRAGSHRPLARQHAQRRQGLGSACVSRRALGLGRGHLGLRAVAVQHRRQPRLDAHRHDAQRLPLQAERIVERAAVVQRRAPLDEGPRRQAGRRQPRCLHQVSGAPHAGGGRSLGRAQLAPQVRVEFHRQRRARLHAPLAGVAVQLQRGVRLRADEHAAPRAGACQQRTRLQHAFLGDGNIGAGRQRALHPPRQRRVVEAVPPAQVGIGHGRLVGGAAEPVGAGQAERRRGGVLDGLELLPRAAADQEQRAGRRQRGQRAMAVHDSSPATCAAASRISRVNRSAWCARGFENRATAT
jgi:hypothetical protein